MPINDQFSNEIAAASDMQACDCLICQGGSSYSRADGKIMDVHAYLANRDDVASGVPGTITRAANGGIIKGNLNNEDQGDLIAVNLVAGQTYTFSLRSSGDNGIVDPFLRLIGQDGKTVLVDDDDGGFGSGSQITFTATTNGTHYLNATSWYQSGDPTAPDFQDNGDYEIATWTPDASQDAGSSIATTTRTLEVGTSYEYLEAPNDIDYYAVQLTAGNLYTFTYNGGIALGEARNPGESVGVLSLYTAANATSVGLSVNTAGETSISFFATQTGTYYLRAESLTNYPNDPGPEATGGYTIDVASAPLSSLNPLDAIDWKSSDVIDTVLIDGKPTAKVYFAVAGETFGERTGANPINSYGWNDIEKAAVMDALTEYTKILGINYEITTNATEAEFRLITTAGPGVTYGAYMYPQDPVYGTQEGISAYNVNSGGWDKPGVSTQNLPGDQVSLNKGGFSYAVILHEMGHGHGLAHPHDRGGGSQIMPGVSGASGPGTFGVFDLNQGVYTVMSYNDAAPRSPNGPSPFTIAGIGRGWSGTLGAFDIAMLQEKYGVRPDFATGNDVYTLDDVNATGTYYETIYDTAGNDTINYVGMRNVQIDLTAATLDYSPTGGGVLSYATGIFGGFSIANGVVIENATGDAGNDVLLGNAAANVLTGGAGDDVLVGRGGADQLNGGAGVDTVSYMDATAGVQVTMFTGGSGSSSDGDRFTGIEKVEGSAFNDLLNGGNEADNLSGLAGDDRINGGNAEDVLSGGAGLDTLTGGNGSDMLDGGDGDDTLDGGNDTDTLLGGAGADSLSGGNGDDVLTGGAGDDQLRGGNGNDRFVFTAGGGTDTILDFRRGDEIDLTAFKGVDQSDITFSSGRIFVENGDADFSIIVQGVRASDVTFAFAAPSMANADMLVF